MAREKGALARDHTLKRWQCERDHRVTSGYIELVFSNVLLGIARQSGRAGVQVLVGRQAELLFDAGGASSVESGEDHGADQLDTASHPGGDLDSGLIQHDMGQP